MLVGLPLTVANVPQSKQLPALGNRAILSSSYTEECQQQSCLDLISPRKVMWFTGSFDVHVSSLCSTNQCRQLLPCESARP
eukprot:6204122-Pleurochrysis_carterae.AAC.2